MQKKLVKEYSLEGLLHTNDSMTLMSIALEEAHALFKGLVACCYS
jgi:hypothetical protein